LERILSTVMLGPKMMHTGVTTVVRRCGTWWRLQSAATLDVWWHEVKEPCGEVEWGACAEGKEE
jgi:hypothetical protein